MAIASRVAVIIVTYNGMRWINTCLNSLINEEVDLSIYVVDNGSTDGTVRHIQEYFPQVDVQTTNKNLGFGQGNNLAIAKALKKNPDFFFLMNQDAWIQKGSLKKLVAFAVSHPEYGILSPVHLNGKGDNFDEHFFEYLCKSDLGPSMYEVLVNKKNANSVINTEAVNAAAWLVTAPCIRKVGGFDPIFFHYGEDDNYLQRTRYKSFGIGVVPDAILHHDRDKSQDNSKIPLKKKINRDHIQTLVYACDLHRSSYIPLLLKRAVRHTASAFAEMIKLNAYNVQYHLAMAWKSTSYIPAVRRSRRMNASYMTYLHLKY